MDFLGNGGRSLLGGEEIGVFCGDIREQKGEEEGAEKKKGGEVF